MKIKVFNFLIDRYSERSSTPKEKQLIDHWYDAIDKKPIDRPKDLEQRQEVTLQRTLEQLPPEKRSKVYAWRWLSVAAMLCLLAAGAVIWYTRNSQIESQKLVELPAYRVFQTAVGERKELRLSDGSTVTLNARSRMRIDQRQFGKTTRTVELLGGEAFFDVAKDSTRAFIVKTGSLQTRVLGTSFNIQAYGEMAEQVVSVYTGRVQVQRGQRMLGVLTRGQQIRFEKENANSVSEDFDLVRKMAWRNGKTVLQQASFEELALSVNNLYGIRLEAGRPAIAKQHYSMPMRKGVPFEEVLKAICSIHHNKARKEGDTVIIY